MRPLRPAPAADLASPRGIAHSASSTSPQTPLTSENSGGQGGGVGGGAAGVRTRAQQQQQPRVEVTVRLDVRLPALDGATLPVPTVATFAYFLFDRKQR